MDRTVLVIFAIVYLGMMLGRFPGLRLDRTGFALLGAIALLATDRITPDSAWKAVDVPTISLLFGLMVVSAQFRAGGVYAAITRRVACADVTPSRLLALVILVSATLSALLANDVVCLAMTPLLIEGCLRRRLNPKPYLLALACASNVGSAATLIGNPQNMLIGQRLNLSFADYTLDSIPVVIVGSVLIWCVVVRRVGHGQLSDVSQPDVHAPPFNTWEAAKGIIVLTFLFIAFLFTQWPREVVALAAAGILLLSRRLHTRDMLSLVDWQLIVLFVGLFVVNHAMQASGNLALMMSHVNEAGIDPTHPTWLFVLTAVLSNLVSNVPAVMLLLTQATDPVAGTLLALVSTLAGNLIIVGSIANIIVVDQAQRMGVDVSWGEHARVGVPVTLGTLAIAALWLWLIA
jgi:Na+/H+ antiporter NhaD/arsenite permease-like protein